MKKACFITFFAAMACFASCTKKRDAGPGGAGQIGTGRIFYDCSEGAGLAVVYQLDLNTAVRSKALAYNADRHAWDISRDGTRMIQSVATRLITMASYTGSLI